MNDEREAMRQANLHEARDTILHAPKMSKEVQARLDKLWADFDAAYPQPLDLNPTDDAKP